MFKSLNLMHIPIVGTVVLSVALVSLPLLFRLNMATAAESASRPGSDAEGPAAVPAGIPASEEASLAPVQDPGPRVQLAALSITRDAVSQFALAATRELKPPAAVEQFAQADSLWSTAELPRALDAYLNVMESFPDTVQAKASDSRFDHIINRVTQEEADAIAAQLPAMETLKSVDALASVGSFYFLRALAMADTDPERAAAYFTLVCDHGGRIFTEKLDDDFKSRVLEAYLISADAIGRGEDIRVKLSALANEIKPSFTAWLIKTVVDGAEPPVESVPTAEGKTAIKKFWLEKAGKASGPEEARALYVKTANLSWQLLLEQAPDAPVFGHAHDFIQASQGIGEAERVAAVSRLDEWLKSEPLSIMRWIARYELADHLTRRGSSEEEARAGFLHFETLVSEAATGLVDVAINDTQTDVNTRGLLLCVLGHGYYGTNKVDEAEACYNLVLENFPVETHAGESAAFSKMEVAWRRDYTNTEAITGNFKQFAASYPDSYYAPVALIRAGEEHARAGDTANAEQAYQMVMEEYDTSSNKESAREHLEALKAPAEAETAQ